MELRSSLRGMKGGLGACWLAGWQAGIKVVGKELTCQSSYGFPECQVVGVLFWNTKICTRCISFLQ